MTSAPRYYGTDTQAGLSEEGGSTWLENRQALCGARNVPNAQRQAVRGGTMHLVMSPLEFMPLGME